MTEELLPARRSLVAIGRRLAAAGLAHGTSGNASVRVGDLVLLTPTGARLGGLTEDDIAVVRVADGSPAASGPTATKEQPLHLAAYAARPDAAAVLHTHSPWATAVACLPPDPDGNAELPAFTPYSVMRLGAVPVASYATPGSAELAAGVGPRAAISDVVLLANHGPVALGPDPDAAADLLDELEAAARLTLTLRGSAAVPLPAAEVERLRSRGHRAR
ncbi:class II aldolase/adducin family protein [Lysobacter korlensis]|uniref:Class II aldolase/adducin family protein n=1 Tax=Lysobacter korlensis TaxID=553636 RepID=A0ABV6RVX5_9GAMM